MSFAYDVKAELCKVSLNRSCCAVAEGCGVLLYASAFTARLRCSHNSRIRLATASFVFIVASPSLRFIAIIVSKSAINRVGYIAILKAL